MALNQDDGDSRMTDVREDHREEAKKIADQVHCDWFSYKDGIEIIAQALADREEKVREECAMTIEKNYPEIKKAEGRQMQDHWAFDLPQQIAKAIRERK